MSSGKKFDITSASSGSKKMMEDDIEELSRSSIAQFFFLIQLLFYFRYGSTYADLLQRNIA